jgi:parallel beta-helix repeat protein
MVSATQTTFFVATDGNDTWSGRLAEPGAKGTDGPFATLGRARNAVRTLKTGGSLTEPVTVLVRGGKYCLDKTLVFTEEDNGTRECPITYAAYPGERPVLSGGRRLTDWQLHEGAILKCAVPEARGGRWKFRQLFFNGERQRRARWPNFDPDNPLYGGWAFAEGPAEPGSTRAFRFRPETFPRRWKKPSQGEVYICVGKYGSYTLGVDRIDWDERVIAVTAEPRQFDHYPYFREIPFRRNDRFYVENLREELDQPGEWCLDTDEEMVYFWPPAELDETSEVVAPLLHTLVSLRWVTWVTLSGFVLTETRTGDNLQRDGHEGYGSQTVMPRQDYCGEAVHLRGAEHCRVENNHFDSVGGNAIYVEDYNERCVLRGNTISGAGKNGICLIGSQYETQRGHTLPRHPLFNRVEDNHIHHCGAFDTYAAGIFLGLSQGNTVSHNRIEDMPHHGICLGDSGYGRNIVEYNEIRRVCLEILDTGAINIWMENPDKHVRRDAERSGHVIRYNLIADAHGCRVEDNGEFLPSPYVQAIYMDSGSSNCFVYGNIVLRCPTGISVSVGKNNFIENNVFVDCEWGFRCNAWHECFPQMYGFATGNHFCRNIVYRTQSSAGVYGLSDQGGNDPLERMLEQNDANVLFNADGGEFFVEAIRLDSGVPGGEDKQEVPLEDWRKQTGFDTESILADPLFVDLANDDYRLKPESPALKLGFQPIPIEKIGLKKPG